MIPAGRSQTPLAGLGFDFGRQRAALTGDRCRELSFHFLGQDAGEEFVSGHGEMDMFVKQFFARNPIGRLLGEFLRGVHPGHRCAGLLDHPVDPGIGSDGEGVAIARPLEGCPRCTAVVQGELTGADAKLQLSEIGIDGGRFRVNLEGSLERTSGFEGQTLLEQVFPLGQLRWFQSNLVQ